MVCINCGFSFWDEKQVINSYQYWLGKKTSRIPILYKHANKHMVFMCSKSVLISSYDPTRVLNRLDCLLNSALSCTVMPLPRTLGSALPLSSVCPPADASVLSHSLPLCHQSTRILHPCVLVFLLHSLSDGLLPISMQ